jgi:hypothetical protein
MSIRMLLAGLVLLFLIPIGETVLYALPWCGCGYCSMSGGGRCTCGPPYYWCLEDLLALQLQASLHTYPPETSTVPEVPAFTKSDLTENVVHLAGGAHCLHNKNVLHLLGSAKEDMRYIPSRFD